LSLSVVLLFLDDDVLGVVESCSPGIVISSVCLYWLSGVMRSLTYFVTVLSHWLFPASIFISCHIHYLLLHFSIGDPGTTPVKDSWYEKGKFKYYILHWNLHMLIMRIIAGFAGKQCFNMNLTFTDIFWTCSSPCAVLVFPWQMENSFHPNSTHFIYPPLGMIPFCYGLMNDFMSPWKW